MDQKRKICGSAAVAEALLIIAATLFLAIQLYGSHQMRCARSPNSALRIVDGSTISRMRIECTRDTCVERRDTVEISDLWEAYDRCNTIQATRETKLNTSPGSQ